MDDNEQEEEEEIEVKWTFLPPDDFFQSHLLANV